MRRTARDTRAEVFNAKAPLVKHVTNGAWTERSRLNERGALTLETFAHKREGNQRSAGNGHNKGDGKGLVARVGERTLSSLSRLFGYLGRRLLTGLGRRRGLSRLPLAPPSPVTTYVEKWLVRKQR